MASDHVAMTVEVTVEFPDLKLEDVELLDGLIDRLESDYHDYADVAHLENLRDRIARMILTACEGA